MSDIKLVDEDTLEVSEIMDNIGFEVVGTKSNTHYKYYVIKRK